MRMGNRAYAFIPFRARNSQAKLDSETRLILLYGSSTPAKGTCPQQRSFFFSATSRGGISSRPGGVPWSLSSHLSAPLYLAPEFLLPRGPASVSGHTRIVLERQTVTGKAAMRISHSSPGADTPVFPDRASMSTPRAGSHQACLRRDPKAAAYLPSP